MQAIVNRQTGSIAMVSVLIAGSVSILLFAFALDRHQPRRMSLHSAQVKEGVDQLAGQIGYFLSDYPTCLRNFGAAYASRSLSLDQMYRVDSSPIFETDTANPNISYLNGQVKIQSFTLSGFTADASNPLLGTAELKIVFLAQGQMRLGGNSLIRGVPVSLQLDASDNIIQCQANIQRDAYWRTNPYGSEYYWSGNVGVANSAPDFRLDIAGSVDTGPWQTIARFGSAVAGGVDFMVDPIGPTWGLGAPGGGGFVFSTNSSGNPVVFDSYLRISVNYPIGTTLDHVAQLRSTDTTPFVTLRSARSSAQPRWDLVSDAPGTSGHLIFSPQNAASPAAYIKHPNHALLQDIDFRIGSAGPRPMGALGFSLYVFGQAAGSSAWVTASDVRLKERILPLEDSLRKLSSVNGYFFRWKDGARAGTRDMGLVAQELKENRVAEELVDCSGAYCSVQYAPLTALVVEAAKELEQKQSRLEERLNRLKSALKRGNDD